MFVLLYVAVGLNPAAPAPLAKPQPVAEMKQRDYAAHSEHQQRGLAIYADQVRCEPVLRRVLKLPRIARLRIVQDQIDPLVWLKANVGVEIDRQTGSFRVRFNEGNYRDRTLVINAVVTAYRDYLIEQVRGPILQSIDKGYESLRRRAVEITQLQKAAKAEADVLVRGALEAQIQMEEEYNQHHQRRLKRDEASLRNVSIPIQVSNWAK